LWFFNYSITNYNIIWFGWVALHELSIFGGTLLDPIGGGIGGDTICEWFCEASDN
jgi:hypothetical protein